MPLEGDGKKWKEAESTMIEARLVSTNPNLYPMKASMQRSMVVDIFVPVELFGLLMRVIYGPVKMMEGLAFGPYKKYGSKYNLDQLHKYTLAIDRCSLFGLCWFSYRPKAMHNLMSKVSKCIFRHPNHGTSLVS